MTRDEFDSSCAVRIVEYWPSFGRQWNGANRTIAFKILSVFRLDQVLAGLENYRFDNPDSKSPEFKQIAARLWDLRRGRQIVHSDNDLRGIARAWARTKSDDDLDHLRYVAAEFYSNRIAKLWVVFEGCPLRSPLSLICCWSMDLDRPLGFDPGSEEWQELYLEYDIQERAREKNRWSSAPKVARPSGREYASAIGGRT